MPTKINLFGPKLDAQFQHDVGTGVSFTLSSKTFRGGYYFGIGNQRSANINAVFTGAVSVLSSSTSNSCF